jgi:hypothetical protein
VVTEIAGTTEQTTATATSKSQATSASIEIAEIKEDSSHVVKDKGEEDRTNPGSAMVTAQKLELETMRRIKLRCGIESGAEACKGQSENGIDRPNMSRILSGWTRRTDLKPESRTHKRIFNDGRRE